MAKRIQWGEILAAALLGVIVVAILAPALARSREGAQRLTCQSNLKQWGSVFALYSGEAPDGLYPRMQFDYYPGPPPAADLAFGPDVKAVYPEFLTDQSIFLCPSDPYDTPASIADSSGALNIHVPGRRIYADASYAYTGFAMDETGDNDPTQRINPVLAAIVGTTESEREALGPSQFFEFTNKLVGYYPETLDRLPELLAADIEDMPGTTGNGDTSRLFRLRPGVERLYTATNGSSPAPAPVFVMLDALSTDLKNFNHVPSGGNVLFTDGHVEFIAFPGKAPVTRAMANAIGASFS